MDKIIYLINALILIFLDKLVTFCTIIEAGKKFPDKDKFSVEKNPLAQYFFKVFGLTMGSIYYGIFSFFSFFFSVWILDFIFTYMTSFIIITIIYVVVIINNIRWLVKFSRC
jgi:hypothetical protein